MGFASAAQFATAQHDLGREHTSYMHKTGCPTLPAGGMCGDLSMAAGTPKYNAYVGSQLEGTPLQGIGNSGVYLPSVPPDHTLHLADLHISSAGAIAPATFWLCDYLYAYPLIDMDSTDYQECDNSAALVPRYADGAGVRAMLVTTTPQTGVALATVTYTNQAGQAGRGTSVSTTITNVGNLHGAQALSGAAAAQSPFLPLASGDAGIRVINGVQLGASAGGFCAVVLVRPLAEIKLREQNTPAEVGLLINKRQLPRVLPGAFLNFVFSSGVAAPSSVVRGFLRFAWS